MDDMEFLAAHYDKTAIERVTAVAHTPFTRLTYTEAIDVLLEHIAKGKKFEFPVGALAIRARLFWVVESRGNKRKTRT